MSLMLAFSYKTTQLKVDQISFLSSYVFYLPVCMCFLFHYCFANNMHTNIPINQSSIQLRIYIYMY